MSTRKIVLTSILLAFALVIAILESFIPSIGIPGVKLGLANIIILITLYEVGILEAILINALRVLIVSLIRGTFLSMGFFMSLTGAFLSLGVMVLFYFLIKKFSVIGVSVIGSLFHVFGQVLIAMIYLNSSYIFFYLPVIAISAIITGVIVGIVAKAVIHTGIVRKQVQKNKL